MCKWSVTAVTPQSSQDPEFDTSFTAHMQGHEGKANHTGLHSLHGADSSVVQIVNDHKVEDANCNAIYSAIVKLGKKDKYDKVKWDNGKLSTFFPDDMCIDHIKEAVKLAWKNFYGLKNSSKTTDQQSFTALEEMTNTSVKWVGHVTISKKSGNYNVLIGSLQTGKDKNKIYNAFPAIGGQFF